jgi:hypothetical protein
LDCISNSSVLLNGVATNLLPEYSILWVLGVPLTAANADSGVFPASTAVAVAFNAPTSYGVFASIGSAT